MGWATPYIARLLEGETVSFRPRGNSMKGKIASGQLCTVAPVDPQTLQVGDIVLCKVRGNQYLHLIKARRAKQFQITVSCRVVFPGGALQDDACGPVGERFRKHPGEGN